MPPIRGRGPRFFADILAECRRRPLLAGTELLWRLCYGLALAALVGWQTWRIWQQVGAKVEATGVLRWSLMRPMRSGLHAAAAWEILRPEVVHTAMWLLPLAVACWAVAAGIGRNAVARRWDARLPWRLRSAIPLLLLRVLGVCGMFALWYAAVRWSAAESLTPAAVNADGNPDLALYGLLVIACSLGILATWALLSWILSLAPLLAVLEGRGFAGSLVRAVRLGRRLTGQLVGVNVTVGIVRVALMGIATILSAIPSALGAQGAELYVWCGLVTLAYMAAGAFFQTVRVAAIIELWRAATQ